MNNGCPNIPNTPSHSTNSFSTNNFNSSDGYGYGGFGGFGFAAGGIWLAVAIVLFVFFVIIGSWLWVSSYF